MDTIEEKIIFKKENSVYIIGSIIKMTLRVIIGIDSIGSSMSINKTDSLQFWGDYRYLG